MLFKKINELNSIETHSNLNQISLRDQTKFRLNEINKIKTMSKKFSKYIAAFDYIDKTLIVLFEESGGISIISFTSIVGVPAGLASATFTLVFSLTTGIIKTITESNKKKPEKKHNKIVTLANSKLNSIETLISQALIGLDIIHEELKTIVNEKEKYEQMKENTRNTKIRDELNENVKENSGKA